MASPLIVREGGGRTIHLGPDPWNFLAAGADTDDRFDLIHGSVSYLQGPPLHLHDDQDDTFFVLEGRLTVQVGDETTELKAGEVSSAPRGTPHTFTNVHQELVRVVNIMTPGGLGRFFEEVAALLDASAPASELAAVSERHGNHRVGPPLAVTLGLSEDAPYLPTLR